MSLHKAGKWPIHEAPKEVLEQMFAKERTFVELKNGKYNIKCETPTHILLKKRFLKIISLKI